MAENLAMIITLLVTGNFLQKVRSIYNKHFFFYIKRKYILVTAIYYLFARNIDYHELKLGSVIHRRNEI